jgi:hypothetical protein
MHFCILSFPKPPFQFFPAKDFHLSRGNGFREINQVDTAWHPHRWREKCLGAHIVGGPAKSLALGFVPSIIDLSPVLRQQFLKVKPRLFPDALRVRQINHPVEPKPNPDDGSRPHICQRKFVVSKTGVAFVQGGTLCSGQICSRKRPCGRPSASEFEAALAVEQFDDASKLQRRGSKSDVMPLGKRALRPFEPRDKNLVLRIGY